eukprot:3568124-Rhodomonas_salina.2
MFYSYKKLTYISSYAYFWRIERSEPGSQKYVSVSLSRAWERRESAAARPTAPGPESGFKLRVHSAPSQYHSCSDPVTIVA